MDNKSLGLSLPSMPASHSTSLPLVPRMMPLAKLSLLAATCVALSVTLLPRSASAAVTHFTTHLSADQEVPPHQTDGVGTVKASFDSTSKMFKYDVTYSKLTGPATAAHFHGPAEVGANAPPVLPIPMDKLASPIKGQATLTAAQAADLMAGKWYFNVHTKTNPGGEIRGQLMPPK